MIINYILSININVIKCKVKKKKVDLSFKSESFILLINQFFAKQSIT